MKPQNLLTSIFLLPFVGIMGLLTGCSGGGGSSVNSGPSFTRWSDIDPPETVTVGGLSLEADYVAPAPDYTVTQITDPVISTSSSASITYDADGLITRISVTTPSGTVTWDEAAGDSIDSTDPYAVAAVSADESAVAIAINPLPIGWDYQTFGAWETGRGAGAGTVGAISIGAPTAGSAIPTVGSATFLGATLGAYVNADGRDYLTASSLAVNADFVNRSLEFNSFNTRTIDPVTGDSALEPGLALSGTLSYAAGVNAFSGNLTAAGSASVSPMTGTSQGRFYGPNAEELGGVFAVKAGGDSVESYGGAYGAAR